MVVYADGEMNKIYMQDFTKANCQLLASSGNYTVYDRRDDNNYTIRYINNNCWMTQNLRIVASSGKTIGVISAVDSNFTGSDITMYGGTSFGNYTARYNDSGDMVKGVWYSFCAAGARTSGACDEIIYSGAGDICPSGWRLPNLSEFKGITGYSGAFSPTAGGRYNASGLVVPSFGHWWSATPNTTLAQYHLYYNGNLYTSSGDGNGYKTDGYYVRCVAKT